MHQGIKRMTKKEKPRANNTQLFITERESANVRYWWRWWWWVRVMAISHLTTRVSAVISTPIPLCASESVDPPDPRFVRAFARAIRPRSRSRSKTLVAIRRLRARDRPTRMRNASVVWAPTMTGVLVVVGRVGRCGAHIAGAALRRRWWTTCVGTTTCPRHRHYTCTLGRGSARRHFVGAGSDAGSKTLQRP